MKIFRRCEQRERGGRKKEMFERNDGLVLTSIAIRFFCPKAAYYQRVQHKEGRCPQTDCVGWMGETWKDDERVGMKGNCFD